MSFDKQTRLAYTSRATALVTKMTLKEKAGLMVGNSNLNVIREVWSQTQDYSYYPYTTKGCASQDVPAIRFSDGPRGVVCGVRKSTCFPATMCRGATFDTNLEEEIGAAIAKEIRAYGANLFGGVCVNLPYHPGWGRSQEVFGEDSFAMGQMGAALVRGVQKENVMACVKHYAFNSMENNRFVDIECDIRTEREVFLPHFKDCIDAGAACVMGAFNKFRGEYCCHSGHLLREVLKEEWDFDGFVISDWFWGIKDTVGAVRGGADIEMPVAKHYGPALLNKVKTGQVSEKYIDESALRIVRTVLASEDAYKGSGKHYGKETIGCRKHADLALKAAQEGITLLKNYNRTLPFSKTDTKRIAVLGKLALDDNLGDHGSGRVFPAYTVTPLDGIAHILPQAEIIYYSGEDIAHAKCKAAEADAVVFIVGLNYEYEGEFSTLIAGIDRQTRIGGDRSSISLHPHDIELIQAVGPVNQKSAVVLIGGGTILLTQWFDNVSAALMAYYPGQEGGTAISEILFGDVNPSGKLPFVIPYREDDLPSVNWNAEKQTYGYYHGYAKLEKEGIAPLLPFGFGLSYTEFALSDAEFSRDDEYIYASCMVKNIGSVAGDEVIQLYVGFEQSSIDRPHKLLRGFCRVSLKAGECKTVQLSCPIERIKYYDVNTGCFMLEHMEYELYIGSSSDENSLLRGSIAL